MLFHCVIVLSFLLVQKLGQNLLPDRRAWDVIAHSLPQSQLYYLSWLTCRRSPVFPFPPSEGDQLFPPAVRWLQNLTHSVAFSYSVRLQNVSAKVCHTGSFKAISASNQQVQFDFKKKKYKQSLRNGPRHSPVSSFQLIIVVSLPSSLLIYITSVSSYKLPILSQSMSAAWLIHSPRQNKRLWGSSIPSALVLS